MAQNLITKHIIETVVKPTLDKSEREKLNADLSKIFADASNIDFNTQETRESLNSLAKAFQAIFAKAGDKSIDFEKLIKMPSPDVFAKLGELAAKQFWDAWNSVAKGMSGGASQEMLREQFKQLEQQRAELLKRQKALPKRHKKYDDLSMVVDDLPYMDENEFEAFTKKEIEKMGGNIDKIATDMVKAMNDAIWGLKKMKLDDPGFDKALEDTLEKTRDVFRMSRTLNKNPGLVQNAGLLEEYDFDYLKDTFGEDLSNYSIRLSKIIARVEEDMSAIPLKLKEIDEQLANIRNRGIEIVDQTSAKNGLKTLNEIEEAYKRVRTAKGDRVDDRQAKHILSALDFDPTTSKEGIKTLYDQYQEAAASGDWVEEYRALLKYVRLYESYLTTTNKAHSNKITKRGNPFSPLYEQLKPMADNAQNMLQNILNMGEGKPLVGMGGATAGSTPEDVANAQKIAEAERIAREEAEKKAQIEREAEETARKKRIEEEKAAEASRKAAEEAERESAAKESTAEASRQIGYHYGNLLSGKKGARDTFGQTLDNLTVEGDPGTPSSYGYGIFGGGLFYVDDPNMFGDEAPSKGSKFIQGIDFSKYNLYLATTEERVTGLASLMSNLQRFSVKQAIPDYDGFDEQLKGVSIDTLWQQMQVVFENVDMTKQEFNQFVQEMVKLLQDSGVYLDKETKELMFDNISDELDGSDNISTRLLKKLGYQGVSTAGTSFNGMAQGSVLFDFKDEDIVAVFDKLDTAIEHYNRTLTESDSSKVEESLQIVKEIDAIIERIKSHKSIMSEATGGKFDSSSYDATLKALEARKLMLQEPRKTDEPGNAGGFDATDAHRKNAEDLKEEITLYDKLKQKVEAFVKIRKQKFSLMEQKQPWTHLIPEEDAARKDIASLFPESGTVTASGVNNMLVETLEDEEQIFKRLANALGIEIPQTADVSNGKLKEQLNLLNQITDAYTKLNNVQDDYDNADNPDKLETKLESAKESVQDLERQYHSVIVTMQDGSRVNIPLDEEFSEATQEILADAKKIQNVELVPRSAEKAIKAYEHIERVQGNVASSLSRTWSKASSGNGRNGLEYLNRTKQQLEILLADMQTSDPDGQFDFSNANQTARELLATIEDMQPKFAMIVQLEQKLKDLNITPDEGQYYDVIEGIKNNTFTTVDQCIAKFKELHGVVGGGTDGGDTSNKGDKKTPSVIPDDNITTDLTDEQAKLSQIQQAVEAITTAVNAKTEAFKDEAVAVNATVDSEIKQLSELETKITTIKSTLEGLFDNIKTGQDDIGTGLSNIVVNVKHPEATDNKVTIDDNLLRTVLLEVFANILTKPEDAEPKDASWAREDTLSTTIKGVLDSIQANTAKIGTETQQTITIDPNSVSSITGNLDVIKTVVEAINNKVVKGTKVTTSTPKKTQPRVPTAAFSDDKKETQKLSLAKFKAELETSGRLTDELKKKFNGLAISLGKVTDGKGLARWSEKFKQLKLSVGIDTIEQQDEVVHQAQVEAEAVRQLIKLYEQLGEAKSQQDNEAITGLEQQIADKRSGLSSVDYATQAKFENAEAKGYDNHHQQLIKEISNQYKELGVWQARAEAEKTEEAKRRVAQLQREIDSKKTSLTLSQEELATLEQITTESKEQKLDILGAKAEDKDQKKKIANDKKLARRQAMTGRAGSAIGRAEGVWLEAAGLDQKALPEDFHKRIEEYYGALDKLRTKQNEISTSETVTDEQQADLINQTREVNKLTEEIGGLVSEYQRLSGDNATVMQDSPLGNKASITDYEQALKQAVKTHTDGKAQVKSFNAETKTLTYTLKTGANEFTEYTAAVRHADGQLVTLQGTTKRTETFLEATKRKMKEISSYMSGMALFSRIGQELRRGIQYVREIDLALTELKKVTDETEETYDKFLKTAAKTGAKLGSTISAVTEATATFAKLGYQMEMASEMAEAAIVYKNVGDNIASTEDAANSIISTLKGFKLEASESMAIVDRFNEVGNRFAITSQGIGEALRLSASALNEGKNSLDESIALITAANEVVNDPSSVGTALKTLTLRLRGSKTELKEMGEDVSDMAATTSQLQAKLLALTSGQVDIMLDENTFKNSTQILREMAAAWENMSDIQRASALELMGGKRQANVLSALIQNFDTVEKVIETSANSTGSALRENERYLDSIQGRIDQFNNSVQAMWNNTLNSEAIKFFIKLGTELIKIVDNVGLLNIAFTGFGVYLMRKFNMESIFEPGTKSLEKMRITLKKLEADAQSANIIDLEQDTRRSHKKKARADQKLEKYRAKVEPLDKAASQLAEQQTQLSDAEKRLAAAQKRLDNYKGDNKSTIQKYQADVKKATGDVETLKVKVDQAAAATETVGKKGSISFKKLGSGIKAAGKALGKMAAQMLAMYAITAILELVSWGVESIIQAIDDNNETVEEAQEKLAQLNNELSNATSTLHSLESEFETLQEQINELSTKSLSFTEEQDLERMKAESQELERQIAMQKVLQHNLQKDTNAAAINANSKYLTETSFGSKESKSERQEEAKETGEKIGQAAGLVLGAAVGVALAPFTGGLSLGLIAAGAGAGAIIGQVAGGAIAESIEESAYNSEESVGDAIDNMATKRAELQAKIDEAFANKDTDAYNKAVEDLNNYDSMMAQHMSQIQANVNSVDYETATTEQQKQVDLWNQLLDKYAITMSAVGANENAINRIFGMDKFESVAHSIQLVQDKLEAGSISSADADTQIQQLIDDAPELKNEFDALDISVETVADSFVKLGEAAAEARGDLSTFIGSLGNAETALKSLGDAFNDFDENGIVTAGTLSDLQETFGSLDGFDDFIKVLGDSSSTTAEVTNVISDMASEYLLASGILSDITDENKDFVISQLEALGVTNAEEYLDGISSIHEAMATQYGVDLSNYGTAEEMKAVVAGTLHDDIMGIQGDTLDELASNYDYDLGNFESVEKAKTYIAAEEAKKRALIDKEAAGGDLDAIRDGTTVEEGGIKTSRWFDGDLEGKTYQEVKNLYENGGYNEKNKANIKAWLDSVDAEYEASKTAAEEAAKAAYDGTVNAIDSTYNQLSYLDDYIAKYNPTLSFDVKNLGGGKSPETKEKEEANDAFQKEMDYWENRIGANQAKYDQLQNEIDLMEAKGQKADASFYEEQIQLENERKWLLEQQKAAALTKLQEIEAAGGEGNEQWWETAEILNSIESELDDVTASIVDLQDAIGEIDAYKFEEFNNRLDNLTSKLETIRNLIAPNGEEDWFDDEGNWTESGVAYLGTYLNDLEFYKQGYQNTMDELAKYEPNYASNKSYYETLGIHSEQEYYDKVEELTDQQYQFAESISDTEQSIVDMYESSIDAVEEYVDTLIDGYNDYIDSVKEALDAERDLYDFKKNVQKQAKDIAEIERRIMSLSGSTNAADIAERRRLEADLYGAREELDNTYYDHAKESQQNALDAEAEAYEENMTRFVEGLRTSLEDATANMDEFLMGVTSMVMYNADTVLAKYEETNLPLTKELTNPWEEAKKAVGDYSGNALDLMNQWTKEGGFFAQFNASGTTNLESPWSAGTIAANSFKTSVSTVMSGVVSNISSNVRTASGELSKLYQQIQDTERRASSANVVVSGSGGGGSGGYVAPQKKYYVTAFLDMGSRSLSVTKSDSNAAAAMSAAKIAILGEYEKVKGNSISAETAWQRTWRNKVEYTTDYYAKGTIGTTRDQWAITDEPQFGDELVLVPGKDGNLSFMRKGTGVVPADMTQKLFELAQIPTSDLMNKNLTAIVPNITKNDFKNEFNFESLVHVDTVDSDTLPKLEKMVDKKIDDFSKALNYSLKRFAR